MVINFCDSKRDCAITSSDNRDAPQGELSHYRYMCVIKYLYILQLPICAFHVYQYCQCCVERLCYTLLLSVQDVPWHGDTDLFFRIFSDPGIIW